MIIFLRTTDWGFSFHSFYKQTLIPSFYLLMFILGRVEAQKARMTDAVFASRQIDTDTKYRSSSCKRELSIFCELWIMSETSVILRLLSAHCDEWIVIVAALFRAHTFNCSLMEHKCDLLIVASEYFFIYWKMDGSAFGKRKLFFSFARIVVSQFVCNWAVFY